MDVKLRGNISYRRASGLDCSLRYGNQEKKCRSAFPACPPAREGNRSSGRIHERSR